jgi:hypothetical protein
MHVLCQKTSLGRTEHAVLAISCVPAFAALHQHGESLVAPDSQGLAHGAYVRRLAAVMAARGVGGYVPPALRSGAPAGEDLPARRERIWKVGRKKETWISRPAAAQI